MNCRHQTVAFLGVPDFSKNEFHNITHIGQGSFGKVFRAVRNGSSSVIKEMSDPHSCVGDKRLFMKETELLKVVRGHENMVQIRGFSTKDYYSYSNNYWFIAPPTYRTATHYNVTELT